MRMRLATFAAAVLLVQVAAGQIANLPPSTRCDDRTISLPESSAKLTCEAVDVDGFIQTYKWLQLNGPADAYLSFARNEATVSGIRVAGKYQFEFIAIDNRGARSSAVVTLTVIDPNSAPSNKAPTVSVGQDLSVRLPQSSVELVGQAFDPENRLKSGTWREQTAPRPSLLSPTANGRATASNLVPGSYVFVFEAFDLDGESASKRLTVNVLPATDGGLKVSAGPGGSVRMARGGLANATLYGSSIGSVAVQWTQLAGPSEARIEAPQSAVTGVRGLQKGVYVFELRARDAAGAEDTSSCTIVVFGPSEAPIIDLAAAFRLAQPGDSFTLGSKVRDPDGSVASTQWAFVSGPVTPTLEGKGETADVRGMTAPGQYAFTLTATDNDGLSSTARTVIAVVPPDSAPTVELLSSARVTVDPALNGSVVLSARATAASGAKLAGVVWEQLSGPSTLPMTVSADGAVSRATLSPPLPPGDYLFQFSAADGQGRRTAESVTVQVLRENQAPLRAQDAVRASVNLPATETTVKAKCYDGDGQVMGYAWKQVSGPTVVTIEKQGDGSSARVSGLAEGEYALLVTCVDDRGASAATPVTLSVLAEALFPPKKLSYVITLPVTSVNISYPIPAGLERPSYVRWRQVSGPTQRPAASQTLDVGLTDLAPGTYVYEVAAVDDRGRAAKDTVAVIVQADSGPAVDARVADSMLHAPAPRLPDEALEYLLVQASGPAPIDPAGLKVIPGRPAPVLELGKPENVLPGAYSFLAASRTRDGSYRQETLRVNVPATLRPPTLVGMPKELAADARKGPVPLSTAGAHVDALGSRGPFAFFWEQLSGPLGGRVVDAHTGDATLEEPVPGVYRFKVTVRDADGNSDSRLVTVLVRGNFPWVSFITAVGLGLTFVGDAVSPGPVLSTAVAGITMHASLVHGSAHMGAPPAAHSEWFDFAHSFAWANLHFPAPWAKLPAGDPLSRGLHARRLQGVDEVALASELGVREYARVYFVGTAFWTLVALAVAFVLRALGRAAYPTLVRGWRACTACCAPAGSPAPEDAVEMPAGLHFPALELRVVEFAFFGLTLAATRAAFLGPSVATQVFAAAVLVLAPCLYMLLALMTYAKVKLNGHTERTPRAYLVLRLGPRAFRSAAEAAHAAFAGLGSTGGAPFPPTSAFMYCGGGAPTNERDVAHWFFSCPPLFAVGMTRPGAARPSAVPAGLAGREKLLPEGPRSDAYDEARYSAADVPADDGNAPLFWGLPGELRILNVFAPQYVWGPRPRAPLPTTPGAPAPRLPPSGPDSDSFYAGAGGLYRCYKQVGRGAGQYGPARLVGRFVLAVVLGAFPAVYPVEGLVAAPWLPRVQLILFLLPVLGLALQCLLTRPCLLPYDNPLELLSAAGGLAIPVAGSAYMVGGAMTAGAAAARGLVTFTSVALIIRLIQALLESGLLATLVFRPLAALLAGCALLVCGGRGIGAGELHFTPEEMAESHYLVTTFVPPLRRSFDVFAAPVPRSPGFSRRFLGHPGEISRGFALYQPPHAPHTVFCLYDPTRVSPDDIAAVVDRELQGHGMSDCFRPIHAASAAAVDPSCSTARESSLGTAHARAGSPALIYPGGQPGQPSLATPPYYSGSLSPAPGAAVLSTPPRSSSRGKVRAQQGSPAMAAAEAASRALYSSGRTPGPAFPTDPRLLPRFATIDDYFRALARSGPSGRPPAWRAAPCRVYVQPFEGPLRSEYMNAARIAAAVDAAVCQARAATPGFLRVYDFFALGGPDAPAAVATVSEPYDVDLETYIRFASFADSPQRRADVLRGVIAQVLLAVDAAVSARFDGPAYPSQRYAGGADDGRSLQFVHGDLRPRNVALCLSARLRGELAAQFGRGGASAAHWKLGNAAVRQGPNPFPGAYSALYGRPPPTSGSPYAAVADQTGRIPSPAGLTDGGPDEAADLQAVVRASEQNAPALGPAGRRFLCFVRGPTGPVHAARRSDGVSFYGGGPGAPYKMSNPYPASMEMGLQPAPSIGGSSRALGGSDPRECFLVDLDLAPAVKIMNMSAASSRVMGADGSLSAETVQGPEAAPRLPPADGAHDLRTFAFHTFHLLAACEDSFGPLGPDLYDLLRSMGDPPAAGAPAALDSAPRRFLRHRFFDPLRRPVPDSIHAATLPNGAFVGYGTALVAVEHAADRPLPPTAAPVPPGALGGSVYGLDVVAGPVPPVRTVATYRRSALSALSGKRTAIRGEALTVTEGPEGEASIRRVEGAPAFFAPGRPPPSAYGPGPAMQPAPFNPDAPYFAGASPTQQQQQKKKSKLGRMFS